MIKVDCKQYAEEILERVKAQDKMGLYIIRKNKGDAGADSYVRGIIKDCIRCGIHYKEDPGHADKLKGYGGFLWDDPTYNGGIDRYRDHQFFPAVVEAVLHIMGNELDTFSGKKVLVIGRSEGLGMPLFNELINRDCTVTLAHSKTIDLCSPAYLTGYDVIVTAVGKPKLIDLNRCFADLVIDVGISQGENGKICGDCYNFDPDDGDNMRVATLPNGVGLITRAVLLDRIKNK